jgi:guanylate kinase
MDNRSKDCLFVISAPSAAGKTTIIKELIKYFKGSLHKVLTCTTRNKRKDEIDKVDYRFISQNEFKQLQQKSAFVEYSLVYGNSYGVLKSDLNISGRRIICLDSKGVENFKKLQIDAVYILIKPPSLEKLKERLVSRGSESFETINIRLKDARAEMDQIELYDYVVINDKLEDAIDMCRKIITGEI